MSSFLYRVFPSNDKATQVPDFLLFWLEQKHIEGRVADIHIQVNNNNNNYSNINNNLLLKQNHALCKEFPYGPASVDTEGR